MLLAVMAGQVAHATEAAARIQNYDRWKDLPNYALVDMGNEFWRVDKADSALVCFVILSNRYNEKMTKQDKSICCQSAIAISNLYQIYYYDFQNAIRYLLRASEIAGNNRLEFPLAYFCSSLATLKAYKEDIKSNFTYKPEVLEDFKNVFHQAIKSNNCLTACVSFTNMTYYSVKHQHIREIDNELTIFRSFVIPDSIWWKPYAKGLCELVIAYRSEKQGEAFDYLSRLDELLPQNCSPLVIARSRAMNCIFKYILLLSQNRDRKALIELDEAEKLARDNKLEDVIVEYLNLKQDYYATHGNMALAKEYELKYFKAKDEFINRSKLLSVEQQQFLFELEEMGEEVKDLQAQKRVRDLIIFGIALLALLVIGALMFLWRNYQNTKQRNLLLFQKNQELLALEAQEKERRAKQGETKKYRSSPMDDPAKAELLQQLYDIMESHPEIYIDGFTLDQLAGLAGANSNYVSQVINEKTGSNFNAFINEYRIKEACRRLSDTEQYGDLTIEAIGQSVGFRSRANFAATFKKFTGMTPTAYQHLAKPHAENAEEKEENNSKI